MKILNILFITTILLVVSCKTTKEIKVDKFFEKWEQDSKIISEKESTSEIENAIKAIVNVELCQGYDEYEVKNFPKLKYFITQEKIKVNMSENLNANISLFSNNISSFSFLLEEFVFKDSIFYNKINCSKNSLKPLILTNEYQKTIRKLKYGFGSLNYDKNKDNARVLLDSRGGKYFRIPYKIDNITFNKSIDSAIVSTSLIYDGYGRLYTKVDKAWIFKKEIWHLAE